MGYKYDKLMILLLVFALLNASRVIANPVVVFSNLDPNREFQLVGTYFFDRISVTNAIEDIMEEGETKVYTINNIQYEVNAYIVYTVSHTASIVKMKINGIMSNTIKYGQADVLANGVVFGVKRTLLSEPEEVTGGDLVEFYMGVVQSICGNNFCDMGENANNCAGDCVPVCGNYALELGEECDDGNSLDDDACINCKLAVCGDNYLYYLYNNQGGNETCESSLNNDPFCRLPGTLNECTKCGDFGVQSNEQCDDGGVCTGDESTTCNSNGDCRFVGGICAPRDGDGCSATCQKEVCNNDGVCDIISGETSISCPTDCPCGNNVCDANETCEEDNCCSGVKVDFTSDNSNCGDCGVQCEGGEVCDSGKCTPICGDGICNTNENCEIDGCHNGTCEQDNCYDRVENPTSREDEEDSSQDTKEVRHIEFNEENIIPEEALQGFLESFQAGYTHWLDYKINEDGSISFDIMLGEGETFSKIKGYEFNGKKIITIINDCELNFDEDLEEIEYSSGEKISEQLDIYCTLTVIDVVSKKILFGQLPLSNGEITYIADIGDDYAMKINSLTFAEECKWDYCDIYDLEKAIYHSEKANISVFKKLIRILNDPLADNQNMQDNSIGNGNISQTGEQPINDSNNTLETSDQSAFSTSDDQTPQNSGSQPSTNEVQAADNSSNNNQSEEQASTFPLANTSSGGGGGGGGSYYRAIKKTKNLEVEEPIDERVLFECGWFGLSECGKNERCVNNKCVPHISCGDTICNGDETPGSCLEDCGCKEGYELYNDQCIKAEKSECSLNSDCSDGNACTIDICSGKPLKCAHNKIVSGCSWNNECISIGTRIGNFYCSENNIMKIIEVTNSSCNNAYECETGICSDNKCKTPNIIKKTFNLLKRIFWFL